MSDPTQEIKTNKLNQLVNLLFVLLLIIIIISTTTMAIIIIILRFLLLLLLLSQLLNTRVEITSHIYIRVSHTISLKFSIIIITTINIIKKKKKNITLIEYLAEKYALLRARSERVFFFSLSLSLSLSLILS